MSRSRRKSPICSITCSDSEKWDKQKANRRFRKHTKQLLRRQIQSEELEECQSEVLPEKMKELCEVWSFAKDGKQRFDPEKWPDLMRK